MPKLRIMPAVVVSPDDNRINRTNPGNPSEMLPEFITTVFTLTFLLRVCVEGSERCFIT
jgi:hypothetical protein